MKQSQAGIHYTQGGRVDMQFRGFALSKDELKAIEDYDLVFKAPGIVLASDDKVTSQTKLFLDYCPSTIVGITGTEGKSTTSSLIYSILKEAGFTMQDLNDSTNGAAAQQALYNGLLNETGIFAGDAAALTETYSGKQSQLKTQTTLLAAAIGDELKPVFSFL